MASDVSGNDAEDRVRTVLFAHDEFGQSVAETLLRRPECPRGSISAYRCHRTAHSGARLEWYQYSTTGSWSPVAARGDTDPTAILWGLIEGDNPTYSRIDMFLVTPVAPVSDSDVQSQLAHAIRRTRSSLNNPGWDYLVTAPNVDKQTGSAEIGQTGNAEAFEFLLEKYFFDYVLLVDGRGTFSPIEVAVTNAAADTIGALTYKPFAEAIRERLSLGQINVSQRIVSLRLAALEVGEDFIEGELRATIVRRLIDAVLDQAEKPIAEPNVGEVGGEDLREAVASAGWNIAKLRLILRRFRDKIAARESLVIRDLIRDAGTAAHATAYLRVNARPMAPVAIVPSVPSKWPLIAASAAGLIVLGALFFAAVSTTGGIIVPALLLVAGIAWVIGTVWLVKLRTKTGPPARAAPAPARDERAEHAVRADRYRNCRNLLVNARSERAMVAACEENINRALQFLQTGSVDGPSPGSTVTLPDAVCVQLLQARGINETTLFEDFVAESGTTGELLTASDPEGAKRAMEEFAGERLSQSESVGWAHLAAFVEGHDDVNDTWLGQSLRMLRRLTDAPGGDALRQARWQLVLLPQNTPDGLQSKVRLSLPADGKLLCSGANAVAVLQLVQSISTAPLRGVSPI